LAAWGKGKKAASTGKNQGLDKGGHKSMTQKGTWCGLPAKGCKGGETRRNNGFVRIKNGGEAGENRTRGGGKKGKNFDFSRKGTSALLVERRATRRRDGGKSVGPRKIKSRITSDTARWLQKGKK